MAGHEITRTTVRRGIREAAAWRIVADWFGRHSHELWLRRLRLADGEDVLRVYVVRPEYRSQHADLSLGDRDAVRCYTDDWQVERLGIRERLLSTESTAEILDGLCSDLELPCQHEVPPPTTERVLAYRRIASVLGAGALADRPYECHSVVQPFPSAFQLRRDLLGAFGALSIEAPAHAYPPGALDEPAYGWWILTRDGRPRLAISEQGGIQVAEHGIGLGPELEDPIRLEGAPDPLVAALLSA
jgi:hypothetical protein